MKYINRWGLMRNTRPENICEHSLDVSVLAHALALLRNRRFGGTVNPSARRFWGCITTRRKSSPATCPRRSEHYNPEIRNAYREVEQVAQEKLLSLLPEDLRPDYRPLLVEQEEDRELWRIVKAADKISALIKCLEENGWATPNSRRRSSPCGRPCSPCTCRRPIVF